MIKRIINDLRLRTVATSSISLIINLGYAIFNCILGIKSGSYFLITLFIYYATLSTMRFYTITYEFHNNKKRSEWSTMNFCGWLVCLLAVIISIIALITIKTKRISAQNMIVMIAIAAYTFFKATVAIINIIKLGKNKQPLIITLRNISLCDAAMSMLMLEHSMLSTFSNGADEFTHIMDIMTGAGVFLIVFTLGITMIIYGRRKR